MTRIPKIYISFHRKNQDSLCCYFGGEYHSHSSSTLCSRAELKNGNGVRSLWLGGKCVTKMGVTLGDGTTPVKIGR